MNDKNILEEYAAVPPETWKACIERERLIREIEVYLAVRCYNFCTRRERTSVVKRKKLMDPPPEVTKMMAAALSQAKVERFAERNGISEEEAAVVLSGKKRVDAYNNKKKEEG